MSDYATNAVGVDISKAHLDAHHLASGRTERFANDASGFRALLAWAGPGVECVAYESTGPWHRAFEEALVGELPLSRVNALRARRFAEALGEPAKTDAADARVLALMAAALKLRRLCPVPAKRRSLDELGTARDALVADRVAALNRAGCARHPLLKRQLRARLAQVDRQIKSLDAEVAALVAADAELARRAEVLTSMPGVGPVTAAGLLTEMPELGALDGKSAASLAGLAPFARESGTWKGRGFIRGGRARARRLLYMPALSAIRRNPDLARKYRELRGRGKPAKVALTAIMRKMLVLANTLLREDRLWTPTAEGAAAQARYRFHSSKVGLRQAVSLLTALANSHAGRVALSPEGAERSGAAAKRLDRATRPAFPTPLCPGAAGIRPNVRK